MRLSQRLIEENRKLNREKRRANDNRQEPDEDVETLIYDQPPKWGYLNDQKGVFKGSEGDGINNQPDIFERTAIFHTKSGIEAPENNNPYRTKPKDLPPMPS